MIIISEVYKLYANRKINLVCSSRTCQSREAVDIKLQPNPVFDRNSCVVCPSTMNLRRFTVLVCIILLVFVAVDGRGRGSRSGSFRSRSRSNSGSSGSSGKSKITKNTPIKATTVRSPVIVSQTKQGLRSSTFTKAVVAYLVLHYTLRNAPVYRQGYPMYRSYADFPEDRAARITSEKQTLLDNQGNLCLGKSSTSRTLREGIDDNLIDLKTTVTYKTTGETKEYHEVNNTISLEDIKDQDFEITTKARYNTPIVAGTTCTCLEKIVEGTMVQLYETNPDSACAVFINVKLLIAAIALLGFLHGLQ